jgi:hypothetical protein
MGASRMTNVRRERGRFGIWKGCFVNPQDFRRWNKRGASLIGPSCPLDARTALFPDPAQMPLGCEIKAKYVPAECSLVTEAFITWPVVGAIGARAVPIFGSAPKPTPSRPDFAARSPAGSLTPRL